MKLKSILFIGFISLLATTAKAQAAKMDTLVVKTKIYCSHCKECESCGGKLEKELFFDKGIKRITIDDKANTITVAYNAKKTSPEKIRVAISKLGYDADGVKALPEAVAKLDGCCKKK